MTNAYGVPPEELGGQPSSKAVAQAFTSARLVKGFNHLVAAVLDQDPAVHGGRRVVFLASDDAYTAWMRPAPSSAYTVASAPFGATTKAASETDVTSS